jgi:hypothetical protein
MLFAWGRQAKVNTAFGVEKNTLTPPAQRIRRAAVFPTASALSLILILLPAAGNADTVLSFSEVGFPSNGTVSGNTVSGVTFNTIFVGATSYTVNNFIEAYSNGVLTFTVSGGGSLAASGMFSNVSGTTPFITINEAAPVFGNTSITLLTAVTSLSVSAAFLGDLGLTGLATLDSASSTVAVSQSNGNVFSTNVILALQSLSVPEASTFSMLAVGLLGAGLARIRRKLIGVNRGRVA